MHLLADSIALLLCRPGAWWDGKHGTRRRQARRVLHLATDTDTGDIAASVLTGRDADDGSQVGSLLNLIDRSLSPFIGDGSYDRKNIYAEVTARHPEAAVVMPPRASAALSAVAETDLT
ncbi:transposase [Belnapia sp. T18]|uniref:Transposase n=1 Tax=Belnapia arida TaxID=2804533 RepID=A0ABS1UAJ2_9PROT|nr:transposase [Belnapia arida]